MDTQILDHAHSTADVWDDMAETAAAPRMTLRLTLYSDRALVIAAQGQGSAATRAAQMLLERHGGLIRVIAQEYAPDAAMVEDVEQECRIHLLTHLSAYDPSRPLKPWMQTVIRNCARNFRRRARRWRMTLMDEDTPEQSDDGAPLVEDLDHRERDRTIQEEVAALPSIYRDIVTRRYFTGESCERIAVDLHLPVGTVKNRLFRARRLLEGKLAQVALAG